MTSNRKNTRRKQTSWFKSQLARRPRPIWLLAVTDLLIFAVALLSFAYFHHVRSSAQEGLGLASRRTVQAEPTAVPAEAAAQPVAAEPTQAPVVERVGYFGDKFADKFTDGKVISTDTSYQSASLNITFTEHYEQENRFYVADIYVKDIECLQSAFAEDKFGKGFDEWPQEMDARLGSILTINGDYYGLRDDGVVLRNGVLYRDDDFPMMDVCVLYWDGTMVTYPSMPFKSDAEIEKGAYQVWNFGPMLLDETGASKENFNSAVEKANPRTAIGYFEPGHYCFVAVDGRNSESGGFTMAQLSKLMEKLGCKVAYNLDGGKTSIMVWNDQVANVPKDGGRRCSDAIMILDMQI